MLYPAETQFIFQIADETETFFDKATLGRMRAETSEECGDLKSRDYHRRVMHYNLDAAYSHQEWRADLENGTVPFPASVRRLVRLQKMN